MFTDTTGNLVSSDTAGTGSVGNTKGGIIDDTEEAETPGTLTDNGGPTDDTVLKLCASGSALVVNWNLDKSEVTPSVVGIGGAANSMGGATGNFAVPFAVASLADETGGVANSNGGANSGTFEEDVIVSGWDCVLTPCISGFAPEIRYGTAPFVNCGINIPSADTT